MKERGAQRETTEENLTVIRDEESIVSVFVKFKVTLPLLCYLLDPLISKYKRAWSSMTNFVDRFQDLSIESYCHQGEALIFT